MKTNSNLNKMCYISLIEKLITSFRPQKIKIGQVLGGVFGHESFT